MCIQVGTVEECEVRKVGTFKFHVRSDVFGFFCHSLVASYPLFPTSNSHRFSCSITI